MGDVSLPLSLLLQLVVPLFTVLGVWITLTNRVTRLEERIEERQKAIDRENHEIKILLERHSKMLQEVLVKLENKQNRTA